MDIQDHEALSLLLTRYRRDRTAMIAHYPMNRLLHLNVGDPLLDFTLKINPSPLFHSKLNIKDLIPLSVNTFHE